MSVLYTFPGQGAQCPDMLHTLPGHPEVRRTIDEAGAVLGFDPLTLDSIQALRSTVAVRVVALRGRLMEQAYVRGYGMTAIVGLRERQLERLIAVVNSRDKPVFLANINDETQMVIAGRDEAMRAVAALARKEGAYRCERLDVSVPSHCALLDGVATELTEAFSSIQVRRPHLAYLSSSLARPLFDGGRIADDLARNVARQVRWQDTVRLAWERGARLSIEMPSGNVLTRLTADVFGNGLAVSTCYTPLDSIGTLMEREQHVGDCGVSQSAAQDKN